LFGTGQYETREAKLQDYDDQIRAVEDSIASIYQVERLFNQSTEGKQAFLRLINLLKALQVALERKKNKRQQLMQMIHQETEL
jgi:hypothetical protein